VPFDAATAKAIVAVWPTLRQKHLESAALGVAVADPQAAIEAAFASAEPANLAPFVAAVARQLGTKQEVAGAAKLVTLLARQPAALDGLKQVALEGIGASLKPENAPAWSAELESALLALVKSPNPGLAGSALPLVARWDKAGAMAPALAPAIAQMTAALKDASRSDDERAQVAVNLLGVRKMGGDIVGTVSSVLVSGGSESLQRKLIEALGTVPDVSAAQALIKAYGRLDNQLRTPAFAQLLKRVDWSQELLKAIRNKEIDLATLGPANMHRLRTHPDLNVAKTANAMIDEMRGPELKEKDTLIAQFMPVITQPGNVENGHKLFTANCATCHVYKNEGKDLAPNLTGMGAHGPADLLVHVLDPNRVAMRAVTMKSGRTTSRAAAIPGFRSCPTVLKPWAAKGCAICSRTSAPTKANTAFWI
jgi:hypothetical protein